MKPNCTNLEWVGRARCSVCDVRNFVLFAGLPANTLDSLLLPIDNLHAPQHHPLYGQGEAAAHVYTIRSGLIKLRVDLPNGGQRIVRLLGPGDLIGMEALVGDPYHHSAIVMQDADLCRIPLEVVRKLDQTSPEVHRALQQRWQRSVDQADLFITSLSTGSAESRMARLLMMLLQSQTTIHTEFSLPSREDMGALLGITTETASRIMAEFKRRGLVQMDRSIYMGCDQDQLAALAES